MTAGKMPYVVEVRGGIAQRIEPHPVLGPVQGLRLSSAGYAKDRLLSPMRRVGERGEGLFTRITWDERSGRYR